MIPHEKIFVRGFGLKPCEEYSPWGIFLTRYWANSSHFLTRKLISYIGSISCHFLILSSQVYNKEFYENFSYRLVITVTSRWQAFGTKVVQALRLYMSSLGNNDLWLTSTSRYSKGWVADVIRLGLRRGSNSREASDSTYITMTS